ncbi:IPTL-CTERM sorting domain-containing protein [Luminiphilus sp.]|nr:IPTL-CTERM sorting domain-containing protein [Luminiphilus sp.]
MRNTVVATILFALLLGSSLTSAATFDVTSASCSGPGSFQEAVADANSNPGPDTVAFKTDVSDVQDAECGLIGADPSDAYMAQVTDELVIEGNGHSITGGGRWFTDDGFSNIPGVCPRDIKAIIRANPVGLIRLEDGVKVTVNDLKLKSLRAIAFLQTDTDLTLNRMRADRTFDFYKGCDFGAIYLDAGTNQKVTINDSLFSEAWNDGLVPQGREDGNQFWGNAFLADFISAGTISISNSRFVAFADIPVIDSAGTVNIETTEFKDTGFINIRGGTATVVNSLFMGDIADQGPQQRIMASNGGSITLEASTIALALLDCDRLCPNTTGSGVIIATNNATIELKASAVSVGLLSTPGLLIREATGGNVTATAGPNPNWLQPVMPQDATALKAILDQPALLTDAPGLPNKFAAEFFYEAATPLADDGGGTLGLLIDSVTDAGTTNQLLSPITGNPITEDIFGNPRTEAGGTVRNIGAVQLGLAPTLVLTATGNALVDLTWTRPLDPVSGAISGYDLCYGSGALPDPTLTTCVGGTQIAVSGPDTLSTQVNGLTNGTTYWFQVRGVHPAAGPWSNQVTAIPAGVPDAPAVSTIPATGAVQLNWTTPNNQGSALTNYIVQYRPAGTTTWLVTSFTGLGTNFTVGGLTDLTPYEFSVTATNGIGSSNRGLVTATPRPAPYVAYANVTGFENNALTILPTFANVYGTAAYSLVSGSLPPGMTLSTTTGEITGTPTTANSYPLTIELVDSSFPTPVQSAFTVTIQPNTSATLTANYDNYAGPAGSALGSPLRPNVTGSTGTLSFTLAGGDPLPSGLALNPTTGEISGTPDTATGRVYSLNMEITDSLNTINEPFNIEITPTLFYSASQGILGDALSVNPSTSPAVTPGTYQLPTGQVLPAGLNLDPTTGSITGTPEVKGLSTVTVEYTTNFQSVSAQVPITIEPYVIDLSYPPIAGEIGQALTIQPSATGLKGTATYSISSGSLPAGLSLNPATGVISGTPTGSATNGIVVIAVADLYEFGSSQVLTSVTAPTDSAPQSIPTLQSWALIALAFLMAGIGLRQARRTREFGVQ